MGLIKKLIKAEKKNKKEKKIKAMVRLLEKFEDKRDKLQQDLKDENHEEVRKALAREIQFLEGELQKGKTILNRIEEEYSKK